MGKGKLEKFEELKTFDNVLEPELEEVLHRGHPSKGRWREERFSHDGPLYLELGCGKGEYSLALARRYPEMNFLGMDIKGNRIWNGARRALEEDLKNVAFLRTRVEFVDSFFAPGEVDGIWFSFPDPQNKERRAKKRLTGPRFLDRYASFLKPGAPLHLKTDDSKLHEYTRFVLEERGHPIERDLEDVHGSYEILTEEEASLLQVRTFYEEAALWEGKRIKYLRFRLE